MDGSSSTHGTDEKYIQNFGLKASMEETTWKTSAYIGGGGGGGE
jgi:hypothetical protein